MKTSKQMYINIGLDFGDKIMAFNHFYLDVHSFNKKHKSVNIYKKLIEEQFVDFFEILQSINDVISRVYRKHSRYHSDDIMFIEDVISMIVRLPKTNVPELDCIRYLCKVYRDSLSVLKVYPDYIVSSETGEVVYDFRSDTPEKFLAKFIETECKSE